MALFNDVSGVVKGARSWVETQWTQRLLQVAVFSSIIFWFLSSYELVSQVEKSINSTFSVKLGTDGTRALHAVIFGFFVYVIIRFILDPLVRRLSQGKLLEGQQNKKKEEKK